MRDDLPRAENGIYYESDRVVLDLRKTTWKPSTA